MELMAENHRVEVKVYQQKVKHLEYEHAHGMKRLAVEEEVMLKEAEDVHGRREARLRAEKASVRTRIRELEDTNAETIRLMKISHEKNILKLRQEFAQNLEHLRGKYEGRLGALRDDLRLRHKVEVHEMEERKNLHINQLMRAHDEAFVEMKKYYNGITRANLQLITQLKSQIAEANEKVAANQKLMREIADQNTRLKEPLEEATRDLARLQEELKDADKDRQSLRYAKARLTSLRGQLAALERGHAELEVRYDAAERERNELYDKFEGMVNAARMRAEAKNEVLEKRLAEAESEYVTRRAQIEEVVSMARLDPAVVAMVHTKLDALLEPRAAMIRELQHSVATLTKAHNDAVRVFEAKMREMGLPGDDAAHPTLASMTGVGPAGLVARPTVS